MTLRSVKHKSRTIQQSCLRDFIDQHKKHIDIRVRTIDVNINASCAGFLVVCGRRADVLPGIVQRDTVDGETAVHDAITNHGNSLPAVCCALCIYTIALLRLALPKTYTVLPPPLLLLVVVVQ